MLLLQLFWEFCQIGIVCVGGGYASMPLIQAIVVDKYHWMTVTEFIDIFTISQMTPGPVGINAATFCGTKIAGLAGSIAATLGFVTPPFFLCIFVMYLLKKYGNITLLKGILNGLRPAVVALICVAGLSFIYLALWNTEHFPDDLAAIDLRGAIVLVTALIAVRRKMGVIKLLFASGVLGLVLGIMLQNH